MRYPTLRLLAFTAAIASLVAVGGGCTSLLGDFSPGGNDASVGEGGNEDSGGDSTVPGEGGGPEGGGLALGATCMADGQCAMGHCVDKVCCESACSGVCETCSASGSPGRCVPIAASTDPDMECVTAPVVVDAGAGDAGGAADAAGEAGASDAAATDAADASDGAASDAAASDAAIVDASNDVGFNVPDGGVTTDNTKCVGACNGSRACVYPDKTKTCGTQFCNSAIQLGRFACDGTGHCSPDPVLESCTNYSCVGAACGTSCSQVSDCLPTSFCNSMGKCQSQLGNGVQCTLDNMCQSGHCVSGVCCTSACNIPGGTCTSSGAIGECKCSINCGDGGTCQLFYKDSDGDGYGDKSGTIAANTAAVGCSGAPPATFVADNTDCDDHDGNAHPGQANFYGSPSLGVGTYDYNCDGTLEKSVPEFPGSYCEFCGGTAPSSCASQATCAAAGNTAGFNCGSHFRFFCILGGGCNISYYCANSNTAGFTSTVACGATASYTTCSTCSAANGYPAAAALSSTQQQCH